MKKGFELSINFIVILIITIVVFGLGIRFAYNLFKSAHETVEEFDEQTKAEIERSLYQGNIVAIPINQKELRVRDAETFGLGILNQLGETKFFKVYIEFATAVDEYGDPFSQSILDNVETEEWTFEESRVYEIEDNGREIIPLAFHVPSGTKYGTYVFNVGVYFGDIVDVGKDNLYDTIHQIRITVK